VDVKKIKLTFCLGGAVSQLETSSPVELGQIPHNISNLPADLWWWCAVHPCYSEVTQWSQMTTWWW